MRTIALYLLLAMPAWSAPRPSPMLAPGDVVRIVVEALRKNNSPVPNAGIFTTYRFASPANRAAVGPYGHFLQIVKTLDSAPLFSGRAAEFGATEIRGERAEEIVRIFSAAYKFTLSRQTEGACRGCWMVDGVVRLP